MRNRISLVVLVLAACGQEPSTGIGVERASLIGTWQTGGNVGYGVSMMDTGNPLGSSVFIGYAGYNINLGESQAWVGALYDARLRDLGVRYLFAVQGPQDSGYNAMEIGNSRIAAQLATLLSPEMGFIIVAGHSSGSFVADELLQQLDTGADPFGAIGGRMVFFNLDGDQKYVGANGIYRLRRAYYVNGFNPVTGQPSWNHGAMDSLGAAFASKGGSYQYDASSSGCGAGGCVHISLINTIPHNPGGGSGVDYADFGGRPVNQWWLDVKRDEAGLGQCATPFLTEGLIEQRYEAMGGCGSIIGSPTTNMLITADGNGRYNNFTWGSIYWSFFTGAHAVVEPVYAAWAAANFENGALGYPISDTHAVTGGVQNEFQHGSLIVFANGTSQIVLSGVDAGLVVDAGSPLVDAGVTLPVDGGTTQPVDAGVTQPVDSGLSEPVDAGVEVEDAGVLRPVVAAELEGVVGGCSSTGGGQVLLLLALVALRRKTLPS